MLGHLSKMARNSEVSFFSCSSVASGSTYEYQALPYTGHRTFSSCVVNPDPDIYAPDPYPARMKEQINKILFLILDLWILD